MERVEKELEATVRQPANAEKYRMEQIAEAKRQKVILEAEAEAEAIRVSVFLQRRFAFVVLYSNMVLDFFLSAG